MFESFRRELRSLDQRDPAVEGEELQTELNNVITGLNDHAEYVIDILNRPGTGLRHPRYVTLSGDYEDYIHAV